MGAIDDPDFQAAWQQAQRYFRMSPELVWVANYLYSSGRIDGMAWLNQKNLDRQLATVAVKKQVKAATKGARDAQG